MDVNAELSSLVYEVRRYAEFVREIADRAKDLSKRAERVLSLLKNIPAGNIDASASWRVLKGSLKIGDAEIIYTIDLYINSRFITDEGWKTFLSVSVDLDSINGSITGVRKIDYLLSDLIRLIVIAKEAKNIINFIEERKRKVSQELERMEKILHILYNSVSDIFAFQ